MMSESNNGYIRTNRGKNEGYISSAIMTVQEELLTTGSRDGLATEASLQVCSNFCQIVFIFLFIENEIFFIF